MRIFRVHTAYRSGRLGHLLIAPGIYTEAQLTQHYAELLDDLLRNERGYWIESPPLSESESAPAEPDAILQVVVEKPTRASSRRKK